MERKPIFWIFLIVVFIGGIWFSYHFFPQAIPFLNVNITMDRESAASSASRIAVQYGLKPALYLQAVQFETDGTAKNFIELEGGGTSALTNLLRSGLYSPYKWAVRHYRENEIYECLFYFRPDGKPDGFKMKVPEKEPGTFVSSDSALQLARNFALNEWKIKIDDYKLIENSIEKRPGGRTDYSIVFERIKEKMGEGRFRLKIMVSGDKITEISHLFKVPEAFERRYENMRSANNTIASVGSAAFIILFFIGGIIALFFLLKQRRVIWKQPLFWGLFIGLLQFLDGMNALRLFWMDYDTALSAGSFLSQQVIRLFLGTVLDTVLVTVSIMAAECMTRKAFPGHIQLWKLWSQGVAGSKSVLGRTLGGYLWLGFEFAFVVAFYLVTTKFLGWWSPADTLVEPNILAYYFPWLSPIARSLHAGFWEECLFRAVPLAGAVLISQKFGKRKMWLTIGFVLQIIIFGSGHAGYPNQPAYARMIELIIPSIVFGYIYLRYGLLTSVILHFTFDVVWMSMPFFVSSSPGIWTDRIMVIILSVVPIIIVFVQIIRNKKMTEVPDAAYNSGWSPIEEIPAEKQEVYKPKDIKRKVPAYVRYSFLVLGIAGIIVFFLPRNDEVFQPIKITRGDAEKIADGIVKNYGYVSGKGWDQFSAVYNYVGDQHKFVWQETGKEEFIRLSRSFLKPPVWQVRYAKFVGDVAERAEEWVVDISGTGEVLEVWHSLPEARKGKTLTKDEARIIALSKITEVFKPDLTKLTEISAKEDKKPNRLDWKFTFADTINYKLKSGQARYEVRIAGDVPVHFNRYIFVPEQFERKEKDRDTSFSIVSSLTAMLAIIILLAGLIAGIVRWSRKQFDLKNFLVFSISIIVLGVLGFFNGLDARQIYFETTQPYSTTLLTTILFPLLGTLVLSVGIGILSGFVKKWEKLNYSPGVVQNIILGVSVGSFVAGLLAVLKYTGPLLKPNWPDFSPASSSLPLFDLFLSNLYPYIAVVIVVIFVIAAINHYINGNALKKITGISLLVIFGFVLSMSITQSVTHWLISGIIISSVLVVIYYVILKHEAGILPFAVGSVVILYLIHDIIISPYPGAIESSAVAIIAIALTAYFWTKKMIIDTVADD